MAVFWKVFESVIILLGIGTIGFIIISRKIVPIKILDVISPLIIDIALPCLIFTNIIYRFDPGSFPSWWVLPVWWLGFSIITFFLSIIGMKLINRKYRSEFGMNLLYPNSIFVPLIIIQNLFGNDSTILIELFLFTLFFPAFMFNTYYLFFKNKGWKENKFSWAKFFNPVLIITVIAVLLKISGTHKIIPDAVLSITELLGNTALPLILLLIGGNVYVDFKRKGEIHLNPILLFVSIKNFLFPFIILLLLIIIKPPFSIAFLIFLLSAVPPVTATPILAKKAGGNISVTNQFVISSFIVSIISIPFVMWVFEHFFTIKT